MLKKRQVQFQTYTPEEGAVLNKENITAHTIHYSTKLGEMWGGFRLFFSGVLLALQGLFKAREKIQDIQMKNAKVLDLRKKKDRDKQKLSFK
jgi:hypothetical protein